MASLDSSMSSTLLNADAPVEGIMLSAVYPSMKNGYYLAQSPQIANKYTLAVFNFNYFWRGIYFLPTLSTIAIIVPTFKSPLKTITHIRRWLLLVFNVNTREKLGGALNVQFFITFSFFSRSRYKLATEKNHKTIIIWQKR